MDLGPNAVFIWASYGVAAVAIGLLMVFAAPMRRGWGRLRERRRGGPRERVLAAVRAFEDDVARLGHRAPRHLDASGRAEHVRSRLGVDARRLYGLGEDARYGAHDPDAAVADEAWREVGRLRRDAHPRVARGHRMRAYLGLRPRTASGRKGGRTRSR